ncbi:MAG: MoaD/ThiS family protein [Candidatus Nanohaloarchaea archaeon]
MQVTMVRDDLSDETVDDFEVSEGLKVGEFLDQQGIERQEVLVSRDGKIISETAELEDGDEINVFDVIAGG